MPDTKTDILVDIADEDLPQLAKIYEKHKEWAPQAYSAITNGIEWKKSRNAKYMTFVSPNNCWKEDGTFFLILECHCFTVFIFTLDKTGKNMSEAIKKTSRLDTDFPEPRFLYCTHIQLYAIIEEAFKEKNIEITGTLPCYLFSISKDEAIKFDIVCPSDVCIKKLEKKHAATVNSVWPHRTENSGKHIGVMLETYGGYGVFLKTSDELVAWVTISPMGQLALLQTANDHKKKGYGSLIIKHGAKELAKRGHNAAATVLIENGAAQDLFEKIGFQSLGKIK